VIRRIVLRSAIDDTIANETIAKLLFFASQGAQPISLWIDSPGGHVAASLAIRDTFDGLGAPVQTHCTASAGGVAVAILAHGADRTIAHHARVSFDPIAGGAGEVVAEAAEVARVQAIIDAMLAADTGRPLDEIARDRAARRRFAADEAVAYGLVDRVLM
jgi:ATP-dependent Clp protease, protease subunit